MTPAPLQIDPELIRRYDRSGPRYTSYPSADRFESDFAAARAFSALDDCSATHDLSLYFHIPFCQTLCFYCGCFRIPTRRHERGSRYVDFLLAEMALAAGHLAGRRPVRQLHLGGGTPTFLGDADLARLMDGVRTHFSLRPGAECSIEVDPRSVDAGRIGHLASLGFNRLSMGVQDFDPEVQRAINRVQSETQTIAVLEAARAAGFTSISTDLIYGLPHQTVARFSRTLDRIVACAPDRIAVYNYAHMPDRFPAQAKMPADALPGPDERLAILAHTIQRLGDAGYVYIGMDHFAKADDELALALANGTLQRNFQGYSTHADCELLGFGVSAIGCVADTFLQNTKDIDAWEAAIQDGVLPVQRGYALDDEDRMCAWVIQSLMCRLGVEAAAFRARFASCFWSVFGACRPALDAMAADGLLRVTPAGIDVLAAGRLLVRHIAMVFDLHLQRSRGAQYSRVI